MSQGGRCGCCGHGCRQAAAECEQRGEGLGVGWRVRVADGRRTEGMKTETGISHSVYKCQPIPVILTFKPEVSFQTLIKIKQSREPGRF